MKGRPFLLPWYPPAQSQLHKDFEIVCDGVPQKHSDNENSGSVVFLPSGGLVNDSRFREL